MSKVVLLLDNPDNCGHCEFIACDNKGEFICTRDKDLHGELNIYLKPDWCPLIPEPERADPNNKIFDGLTFADGWNACLAILEDKANA